MVMILIIFLAPGSYVKNIVPIKDINSILKINKKSVLTSLFRRM